ncbi:MAG: glycosyltransferase [Candidatus Lokiarchaeota archaeon]|nr:glycosyltransferase [Candidatus Lokiarchaeota archaeon]
MKICLVSLGFYPDLTGGRAVYTFNLYKELKKREHEVEVLTGFWNKKIKDPMIKQFKIIKKRYLWVPLLFIQCLKELWLNSYDIIHSVGSRESIICYFSFKKYFATVHDTGSFEVRLSILYKFVSKIISRAVSVIVPSKTIKARLQKFIPKINEKKIIPIPNGVDMDKFHPINEREITKFKEKLGIQGKIILYLGRISYYKGIEDIIDAFLSIRKQIKDVNLILAGKPAAEMVNKYQEWKKKYSGLEIYFTGFIPDDHLIRYYGIADIFVTYSWAAEGFGFTPIEAMACGVPVISSNIPVFREVLQDKAILIPPKRSDLLADALMNILQNNKLSKKLSTEGLNYARKNYNWEKSVDNYEKLYKKIVLD